MRKEKQGDQKASEVIVYISSDYTLDITYKDNSKGNAILQIMDKENLNAEDIIVIGDSYNDVSMFRLTNHSFVMEEAEEEVKTYAKHVVSSVKEAITKLVK